MPTTGWVTVSMGGATGTATGSFALQVLEQTPMGGAKGSATGSFALLRCGAKGTGRGLAQTGGSGGRGAGSTCSSSRSGGLGRPGGELLGGGSEGGTGRT